MENSLQSRNQTRKEAALPAPAIAAWSSGLDAETLANLAHELRTPIQVITGLVEIMRDEFPEPAGAQTRTIVERLNVNVFDLAQTLDNLMTYALMQTGPVQAVDEDLTVQAILAELSPSLEAANAAKNLELKFDLAEAPPLIRAPRRAARSIILNLMLNAIKFTDSGAVTLAIRQARNGALIEFEISDTGSGLRPELLEEVSQPFRQLSSSSARRHRGLGLGLTVVRQTVAMLGGALELRSNSTGGASFVVRFPVRNPRPLSGIPPFRAVRSPRATPPPPMGESSPAPGEVRR